MKFKGISAAVAAFSLVAMPTLAVAVPVATPLTAPAVEKVKGDNAAISGGAGIGLSILAVAAAVAGIVAAAQDGDDDDQPNSP